MGKFETLGADVGRAATGLAYLEELRSSFGRASVELRWNFGGAP